MLLQFIAGSVYNGRLFRGNQHVFLTVPILYAIEILYEPSKFQKFVKMGWLPKVMKNTKSGGLLHIPGAGGRTHHDHPDL